MSDQQLRDEMMTLFLAGHETTANALTWTWYLLSRHPEVEAKLLEELHRVLGGRAPVLADLPKLPYTEMVVREAIRLYPPAPAFGARASRGRRRSAGYDVPKAASCCQHLRAATRRAILYGSGALRPGAVRCGVGGAHSALCVSAVWRGSAGMHRQWLRDDGGAADSATVAQRCKLSLDAGQEITPVQLVTLRPSGPVRMKVERRRR